MNILIAAVYDYNSYSRGIMPDVLQTQIDNNPGATIYYLSNSSSFEISYFNIKKLPEFNYLGKTGVNNTLKLIEGAYQHLKISDIILNEDYLEAQNFFEGKEKVTFNQVYENFEIGEATLSTYISRTRDRDLLHVKQDFVMELAINSLALYHAIKRFLKDKDIDVVYNFNGRQDYVRAIMRAALPSQINCFNVERVRMGGFISFFKNVLPHNIGANKQRVDDCWADSPFPDTEKIEIGSRFFERQRNGESVIFPSYLKNQSKNSLPKGIGNGNENVVLFNSSDDEFAALGAEFTNPIFKNQNEGIEWLVDVYGKQLPNINFIIRMHPNLAGVTFNYVARLKDLHQKYPNIHVVFPESGIDSYALIDCATKILTFGSTLGLEANFYGKPVVLLGKCFYYFSEVAYTPKSKEDVFELLTTNLKPLQKKEAIKFGFYYLKGGIKAKYYYEKNIGDGIYFKDKRIYRYTLVQRAKAKIIQTAYRIFGIRLKF